MSWRIPLADIDFGPEEEAAVQRVLRGRWLTMGEETQRFEAEFEQFTGARHAIAVTNATAALHLACLAVGLTRGNEAVLPSLTFVATANAVRYTGAKVVFADIEGPNWLTISPEAVERAITDKTRAILVMHYAGFACNMHAIAEIARKHGVAIIEDSAHAIGATLDGRHLGTWGRIGCYSFFSNKNMTTGEGGMLTTDDDALAERLRLLRSHGMTSPSWDRHQGHAWSYDVVDLGYNYRIDEMRAALGRVQLAKVAANNQRRKILSDQYRNSLVDLDPRIQMPFANGRGISCHHILPILLPEGADRIRFMEGMKSRGIQTSIHYPPVHQFQAYRNTPSAGVSTLPHTEAVGLREVTLPLYPGMKESDVQLVVETTQQVLGTA